MPLIKSASNKARDANIMREMEEGKEPKQAEAIGYSIQREAKENDRGVKHSKPGGEKRDSAEGGDRRKEKDDARDDLPSMGTSKKRDPWDHKCRS